MTTSVAVIALLASACSGGALEALDATFRAIEHGDVAGAIAHVSAEYRDPLGDRATLQRDLDALEKTFGRITIRATELSISSGATKATAHVVGRLEVELTGTPTTWRFIGPLDVELIRDDGFTIRSGILSDLRDVMSLMRARRAALEGNDAEAYGRLLHPTYRDGDADLDTTRERLTRDLASARIRLEPTLYKIETRGLITHVDEHYLLTVNDKSLPASVARFTLRRAAGPWRIAAGLYPDRS